MKAIWVPSGIALLGFALTGCLHDPNKPPADPRPSADTTRPVRPPGPVPLADAQRYVLALINYDRSKHGLAAVAWDETAAKAGQRHAEDMARNGFTAHWGTDGSVPELRYTEAGGTHMAQENSACFFDGVVRELDPNPMFDPVKLEQIESAFYNEKPPNDGHRKNILKAWHNKVGVGITKPVGIDQPCMAQEFLDEYGDYDGIPVKARVGQKVTVSGEVTEPVQFGGVGLGRIDLPKPMDPAQLNQTSSYRVPEPKELFFPKGFVTRVEVAMTGKRFSIDLELDENKQPGLYMVTIWGKFPENDELTITSLRAVRVE